MPFDFVGNAWARGFRLVWRSPGKKWDAKDFSSFVGTGLERVGLEKTIKTASFPVATKNVHRIVTAIVTRPPYKKWDPMDFSSSPPLGF